jgi:hypothetical protein
MPIYTFLCAAKHQHDVIVPYDTQSVKCPTCAKKAKREGIEVPARRNPEHGLQN